MARNTTSVQETPASTEEVLVLDSTAEAVEIPVATEEPTEEQPTAQAEDATEEAEEEAPARSYNRWTPNSNAGVSMDEVANMRQRFQELSNAVARVEQTYDKHGEDPDTLARLLKQYGEDKPLSGWVGRTIGKILTLKPLLPDNAEGKSLRAQADKKIAAARRTLAELAAEYAEEQAGEEAEEE